MSGTQAGGLVCLVIGVLLSLTLIGAVLGIPLIIAGAVMLGSGNRPTQVQQVFIQPAEAPQPQPYLGEVRNSHVYRLASDGRCYWYPMTDAEKQQHRITAMERELGIQPD